MKAVEMTAVGGPDVLRYGDVAAPGVTGEQGVLVRIHAAGVNPVDTKIRSRGLIAPGELPAILGCDGAGAVESVGAGVTDLAPGDEVWYCHGGLGAEPGNYAEYAVVPATVARRKPETVDFVHAAASPLVLITAWEALFSRARLAEGQTVLVHAGAGGVGHVAIQLARHAGARVIATVGTRDKARFVEALGAERGVLHAEEDFVTAALDWTGGRGVDLVLDTVGGETFRRSIDAVAHYGDLVTLLDPGNDVDWKEARTRNVRIGFELMLTPMLRPLPEARDYHGKILDRCGSLMDRGELKIHVARTLPLAEARAAHALIEEGHTQGKLVLTTVP